MNKNQAKQAVAAFIREGDAVIVKHAVSMLNVATYVRETVKSHKGMTAGEVWESLGLTFRRGSAWTGTLRVVDTLGDTSVSADVIAALYQAVKHGGASGITEALKSGDVKPVANAIKGWTNAKRAATPAKREPGGSTSVTLKSDADAPHGNVAKDSVAESLRADVARLNTLTRDGVFTKDTLSAARAMVKSANAYIEASVAARDAARDAAKVEADATVA